MLAAFISAILTASELILDKVILTRRRVSLRVFLPILFIFLFALTLILVPALGRVDWGVALLTNTLFLLFLMTIVAIAWNVLFYQSIQREKAHQHEMVMMLAPIITIILAAVFFPQELNIHIFILSVIAGFALLYAKGGLLNLRLDATSYNLILAVVLMATENIIIRELLYSYTPVALYALRTLILAVFFMLYYRPRYRQVLPAHWWLIFFSAVLGLGQMLGRFYAFGSIGVIHAMLITMLAPMAVFIASWEVLHERIRLRVVASSLVILGCVIWATVIFFQ